MDGWLVIAVVFGAFAILTAVLRGFDLGCPVRNVILAIAARRLESRISRPDAVERTYWTDAEYQRDATRLARLGYAVTSEADSNPYIEAAQFPSRPPIRTRVPIAHVMYELRK